MNRDFAFSVACLYTEYFYFFTGLPPAGSPSIEAPSNSLIRLRTLQNDHSGAFNPGGQIFVAQFVRPISISLV